MSLRRRGLLVVAHDDWDGVVSALYATARLPRVRILIADYQELAGVLEGTSPPRFFSEVHLPGLVDPQRDIVVDHHVPKLGLPGLRGVEGLRGYMVDRGRVYVSPGRDYSNVSAVRSLLALPSPGFLGEAAAAPPGDIVEASDVLDNPGMARCGSLLTAVGYMAAWEAVKWRVAGCRGPGLDDCLRGWLRRFRGYGGELAPLLDRVAEKVSAGLKAQALLVLEKRRGGLGRPLLLWLQKHLQAPRLYAHARPHTGGLWRVTLVGGREAYEIAARLGGGGRPTPGGGWVAGATAPLAEIAARIREKYGGLHVVEAPPPPDTATWRQAERLLEE